MTDPLTSLHYAPNGNFVNGVYAPGADGFNLADVSSAWVLNALPAGVEGLVWVGTTDGVTAAFKSAVGAFLGNSRVYGFYLADEPGASATTAANLKAESDYIHANFPGVKTFMVEQNFGDSYSPSFYYTPANTHIDLFGLDPYPARSDLPNGFDPSIIPIAVAAAEQAGIPQQQLVPVYQTFGGLSPWVMPTAAQEQTILSTWGSALPTPAFDYAYSWGAQSGDTALSADPALQQVFAAHNGLTVSPPPTVTITAAGGAVTQATQTISGTIDVADVGLTVALFDGATEIGTAVPNAAGSWSATVTLANGVNVITAKVTNSVGAVGTSGAVTFVLGPVTVADYLANKSTLDAIGTIQIADSAADVVGDATSLAADANITSVAITSGAGTLASGGAVKASKFAVSGATTLLTIAEPFAYSGAFALGPGAQLVVAAGDTAAFSGAAAISGACSGPGGLTIGGGSTTINAGAAIATGAWSVTGAATTVGLGVSQSYGGAFRLGGGAILSLLASSLTLSGGAASLSGVVSGTGALIDNEPTTVTMLTLGGTLQWRNSGLVAETGGVTLGDSAGHVARIVNTKGATWAIRNDSGVAIGTSPLSSFANSGVLEKIGGSGTSLVAPAIVNAGAIKVSTGLLDLQGAITGAGSLDIVNAGKLEVDGSVASTQTFVFKGLAKGTLILNDLAGSARRFYGGIAGFAKGDAIDIRGPFGPGTQFVYRENAAGTAGVLTLTDGSLHAALRFAGDLVAANFHGASDAHGGTRITYA